MYDPYAQFEKTVLDNGLTVCVQQWRGKPWESVGLVVHAGARQDMPGLQGTAHFVEHLATENAPESINQIEQFIRGQGGSARFGTTGMLGSHFSFFIPTDGAVMARAFNFFGGALFSAVLKNSVEKERGIILVEYKESYPGKTRFDEILARQRNLFRGLWVENVVDAIGSPETISAITQADLQGFYDKYYVPANTSVVAIGGMRVRDVVRWLERSPLGLEKRGLRVPMVTPVSVIPLPQQHRCVFSLSEYYSSASIGKEFATFFYENVGALPGILSRHVVIMARQMLRTLIMEKLRDESGALYDIAVVWDNYAQAYQFVVRTRGFSADKLEPIEQTVDDSFMRVASASGLLESLKKEEIASLALNDQSGDNICAGARRDLINCHRIITLEEELRGFESVTMDDIQSVAQFLKPKWRYVFIQTP